jgi:hypothetical protein
LKEVDSRERVKKVRAVISTPLVRLIQIVIHFNNNKQTNKQTKK